MKYWIIPANTPMFIFHCTRDQELGHSLSIGSELKSTYEITLLPEDIYPWEGNIWGNKSYEDINRRLKEFSEIIFIQWRISDEYVIAIQNQYIDKTDT